MAINKNHEFEELEGVKCAIVEKNVSPERVVFLKKLLEYNKFKVVVVSSPPPKASAAIKIEGDAAQPVESPSSVVETFTVGVTDYTFNSVNAIFGRLLHTSDGHVVTLAFWQQKELTSHDEIPYFEIDRG
ncbi:MAG: hypothetical protein EBZ95_04200 [Chitinophagia bacterium]|nr:hypothetical protein [Chitinophagia bacterium]